MTLHPQAAAHLRASAGAPTIAASTVPEARLATLGYLALQRESVDLPVQHRFIPGPTADLPIRIIRPDGEPGPRPAIVVLHGSGWVACNLDVVDEPARRLAADTGFTVITVNYQKAPEHPFPIPLDDCIATIEWVREHAAELGVDADRIGVVGDSAGGNLAAAATAVLTDRSSASGATGSAAERPVAALALLYPALDAVTDSGSYREFDEGHGLDAADMAWFWGHYLGVDADDELRRDPRVSPLRAPSLAALPPTYVATAGHDVLRDEGEAYADRLRAASVPVTAQRFPGMIHGFWWMDAVLDEARTLQLAVADFFRTQLGVARVEMRDAPRGSGRQSGSL